MSKNKETKKVEEGEELTVPTAPLPEGFQEIDQDIRRMVMDDDMQDPLIIASWVSKLCWDWADFHLYITSPFIEKISPPKLIKPEPISGNDELEFVYDIWDHGSSLSTSKAEDMFSVGMSMCKLYYTLEKMIAILLEKLSAQGISTETEVQVAFEGNLLAQRKGFEIIINLPNNIVVTNFEPGEWGEKYLEIVKQLAARDLGYPPEAPRYPYKQIHGSAPRISR